MRKYYNSWTTNKFMFFLVKSSVLDNDSGFDLVLLFFHLFRVSWIIRIENYYLPFLNINWGRVFDIPFPFMLVPIVIDFLFSFPVRWIFATAFLKDYPFEVVPYSQACLNQKNAWTIDSDSDQHPSSVPTRSPRNHNINIQEQKSKHWVIEQPE